jgi:hypothetical protein
MPTNEFAERQYEFLLNHHLLTRAKASIVGGMPIIPSQPQEATRGYDALYEFRDGRALFLQIKVAVRSDRRRRPFSDVLDVPYMRFELLFSYTPYEYRQHALLRDLARQRPNSVYYVAPTFITLDDLREAHDAGTLLSRSVCFDVGAAADIAPGDDSAHSIAWSPSTGRWAQFSEPRGGGVGVPSLSALRDTGDLSRVDTTREWFRGLRTDLEAIVAEADARGDRVEVVEEAEPYDGKDADLVNVGRLLARRFDTMLVLLPSA